jgi:hypothetical protein
MSKPRLSEGRIPFQLGIDAAMVVTTAHRYTTPARERTYTTPARERTYTTPARVRVYRVIE